AREWAHANAPNYGLAFPLGHEPWHVELAGARSGGHAPVPPEMAAQAMAMVGGPTAGAAAPQGGGMMLGDIAAQFLAGQQARQQERRAEQEAEEMRRSALLGGGIAGLYG